jgi:hypothetical protein
MKARGKREARRPWLSTPKHGEGLKGRNISPFQGWIKFLISLLGGLTQRRRRSLISAQWFERSENPGIRFDKKGVKP